MQRNITQLMHDATLPWLLGQTRSCRLALARWWKARMPVASSNTGPCNLNSPFSGDNNTGTFNGRWVLVGGGGWAHVSSADVQSHAWVQTEVANTILPLPWLIFSSLYFKILLGNFAPTKKKTTKTHASPFKCLIHPSQSSTYVEL